MTRTVPDPQITELAARALYAGLDKDWGKAARIIRHLHDESGMTAVSVAMMVWIDTYTRHCTGGLDGLADISITGTTTVDYRTGRVNGPMPACVTWAANLFKARIERDKRTYAAMVHGLADVGEVERGRRVFAVLQAAALGIAIMPHGHALQEN